MARDQIRLSLGGGEGRGGEGRGRGTGGGGQARLRYRRACRSFRRETREGEERKEIKPCETKALYSSPDKDILDGIDPSPAHEPPTETSWTLVAPA